MTIGQCRSCGGFTVKLRGGLCSVCVYELYTKATGDEDARLADAVAKTKGLE